MSTTRSCVYKLCRTRGKSSADPPETCVKSTLFLNFHGLMSRLAVTGRGRLPGGPGPVIGRARGYRHAWIGHYRPGHALLAKAVRLQLFVGRFAFPRGGPELRMQLDGILRGRHPIRRKARSVIGRGALIRAKTQAKFLATGDWHCLARPRTMRRKSLLHALTRPPVRVQPCARSLPGGRRMNTLAFLTAARRIT